MSGWAPNTFDPPWLVRVSDDDDVLGAGFVIDGGRVLTCAHIAETSTIEWEPRPTRTFTLAFQFLQGSPTVKAVVAEDGWFPRDPTTGEVDIAVLDVIGELPPEAKPAPLHTSQVDLLNHGYWIYGYPGIRTSGLSSDGTIRGPAGGGRITLLATAGGNRTEGGYSGCPVWDRDLDAVIGMVATAETRSGSDLVSYAIGIDRIAEFWTPIAGSIAQPELVDERLIAIPLTDDGRLPTADGVSIYDLGVTRSRYGPGDDDYVARAVVDGLLDDAWMAGGLVLVTGEPKAGATRSAIELVRRQDPVPRILVPRDAQALRELSERLLPIGNEALVVWLDQLGGYRSNGLLDVEAIERFLRRGDRTRVVATVAAKRLDELSAQRGAGRIFGSRRATIVPSKLSEGDLPEATRLYPDEDFTVRGIGLGLIAAPVLEDRYDRARSLDRSGWAVTQAVIDCRRVGVSPFVTDELLRPVFARYLDDIAPDLDPDEAFDDGLRWAREPISGDVALLYRRAESGMNRYDAFDYLLAYTDGLTGREPVPIPEATWDLVIEHAGADELVGVAYAAQIRELPHLARRAAERAEALAPDPERRSWIALLLAHLDVQDGHQAMAIERLEEVERLGFVATAPLAQSDLGLLYVDQGEIEKAEWALRAAIESRNEQALPLAQLNLGALLMNTGRVEEARPLLHAALGFGGEVGAAAVDTYAHLLSAAPFHSGAAPKPVGKGLRRPALTSTSADRLDPFHRAVAAAHSSVAPMAQANLLGLLVGSGDLAEAERFLAEATESANELAIPVARTNHAVFLMEQDGSDDDDEMASRRVQAIAQLEEAIKIEWHPIRPLSQLYLGGLLIDAGREAEGLELVEEVVGSDHPNYAPLAADFLGDHYVERGDPDEARRLYQRALEFPTSSWASVARQDLAALLERDGALPEAEAVLLAWSWPDGRDPTAMAHSLVGDLWLRNDNLEAAERWYRSAISQDDPEVGPEAMIDLALVLDDDHRDEALGLLQQVVSSGHPLQAPRAASLLGDVARSEDAVDEAKAWYWKAIEFRDSGWDQQARVDLALIHQADDVEEAIRLCTEVIRLVDTDHPANDLAVQASGRAHYVLGLLRLQHGQLASGRAELLELVDGVDRNLAAAASIELAKLASDVGDSAGAAATLEPLLLDDELTDEVASLVAIHLAVAYLNQGRRAKAMELLALETSADGDPAVTELLLDMANELLEDGQVYIAGQLAELVVAGEADDVAKAEAKTVIGIVHVVQGEFTEAVPVLQDALRLDDSSPATATTHRYLSSAFMRLKQNRAARVHAQTVVDLGPGPEHDWALLRLGELADLDRDPDAAVRWLRQACGVDDREVREEAVALLADIYYRRDEVDEARAVLAELGASLNPRVSRMARLIGINSELPLLAPSTRTASMSPGRHEVSSPAEADGGRPAMPVLRPEIMRLIGRVAAATGDEAEADRWYQRADVARTHR